MGILPNFPKGQEEQLSRIYTPLHLTRKEEHFRALDRFASARALIQVVVCPLGEDFNGLPTLKTYHKVHDMVNDMVYNMVTVRVNYGP